MYFLFSFQEVRISSAQFLLLRIPSLKIKSSRRKETFEANLKSECDLWSLMVKEMWAGRKMADEHKVQSLLKHYSSTTLTVEVYFVALHDPYSTKTLSNVSLCQNLLKWAVLLYCFYIHHL